MAASGVGREQDGSAAPGVKPRRGRLARAVALALTLLSLGWSGWWLWDLARQPAPALLVDRAAQELGAVYERALARAATPAALAARLEARLDAEPRDWVAIDALVELAEARSVALPSALVARIEGLDAQDNGWIATGGACAACAWDLRACETGRAMACGVAVNLTVLGDVMTLAREGGRHLAGEVVDEVDVAIAFVGLAATGLVVATGGGSLAVKGGAAMLRIAHRTGRLAPELLAVFRRAFAQGVDWARVPAVRSVDELAALARPAALRPALELSGDLGRLTARLGPQEALRVMAELGSPADAARMARAAEAMGPRTLGAVELLGASRVMRLTLRLSDTVLALLVGLAGLLSSGLWLLAPLLRRPALGLVRALTGIALR